MDECMDQRTDGVRRVKKGGGCECSGLYHLVLQENLVMRAENG